MLRITKMQKTIISPTIALAMMFRLHSIRTRTITRDGYYMDYAIYFR